MAREALASTRTYDDKLGLLGENEEDFELGISFILCELPRRRGPIDDSVSICRQRRRSEHRFPIRETV